MKALFGFEYDDLWKAIIRPPRDDYEEADLGAKEFLVNKSIRVIRTDLVLLNQRKHRIKCSLWEPRNRKCKLLPCVVYLHGNSSSRVEAVHEVRNLLPLNICLFAFDFSGCGQSDGEFISLGWHETGDVACVVDYLRKSVFKYLKYRTKSQLSVYGDDQWEQLLQ